MSDPIELEKLRAAFAEGGKPALGCPPSERIWDAVAGELSPDDARDVLLHGLSCADCRIAIALARTLRFEAGLDPGPGVSEAADVPVVQIQSRRRWLIGALAAAAVIAAIALVPTRLPHHPGTAAHRDHELPVPRALSPAALPRDRFVLRWSGTPEARYTLTVTTHDLTLVHERTGLTTEEVQIPPDALRSLPSGTELVWTVEAELPGTKRVVSPAFLVSIE